MHRHASALARPLATWAACAWVGARVGVAVLAGTAAACGGAHGSSPLDEAAKVALRERMDDVLPPPEPTTASLPSDREGILRELAPLPSAALLVVYEVEGPGGVTGSLEVLARPGGYRRENWTIHVPLGEEGSRQLDGTTVQTPEGVWIEGSDEAPTPSPLGALAEAWLALPEGPRRAVVEQLRAHRQSLALARAAEDAATEHVLDVPCHVTRVATLEMCLWEAAGLPLRYASDGLRLRAIHIDDRANIGEHAFEPPEHPRADVPAVEGFDAAAALQRAAEGDLAELAPWLHPGLRLPT